MLVLGFKAHRLRQFTQQCCRATVRLAALLAAAVLSCALPANAQEPQVMVVFDGSGSIWGRIEGGDRSKLVLMREELVKAMRATVPNAAIGLTTFGAQAGGSCEAASTLLAPATGQLDKLEQLLDQFNPQGRGPIVLGLQTAVDQLQGPNQTRIILIHDGPDNCGRDVCQFARDLAKTKPNIAVDVLSLALAAEDKGGMRCLASATGGQLVEADETVAAIAGLNRIIGSIGRPVPRPTPANPPALGQAKPAVKPSLVASGFDLSARLAGSLEPVTRGIIWRIESVSGLKPPIVREIDAATAHVDSPPARYRITLQNATEQAVKDIEVTAGTRQPVVFDVGGGLVDVRPTDAKAGAQPSDAAVTVLRRDASGRASEAVWAGPADAARVLLLPVGSYLITISDGLARRSAAVDVKAGGIHEAAFEAPMARLIVTAPGLTPEQSRNALISIAVDDAKAPGGRRIVASSATTVAEFKLPAGPYQITLSVFDSDKSVLAVLAAGQNASIELTLQQMTLQVTSQIGDGKPLQSPVVRYRVWRADRLDQPIASSRAAQPVFHLAPGKYRIESRIGFQNAVMIREFDVGSGDFGSLTLTHRAGEVRLALPAVDVRPGQTETYWEIFDAQGQLVWRAFDQSPLVTLAAGTYQATAQTRDRRYAAKFIIIDGRSETVILVRN